MKVKQLKVMGDVSLIKQDNLWEMECSQVKPYHFEMFIRKHNRILATFQAQRVLCELQKNDFLPEFKLQPIYRCTIDELPYFADLPKEQQVSVIENMIPVDAIGDLKAFIEAVRLQTQNSSGFVQENQLRTYHHDS